MIRTAGELAEFLGGRLEGSPGEPIENVADLDTAGVRRFSSFPGTAAKPGPSL